MWLSAIIGLFVAYQLFGTGWYETRAQETLAATFSEHVAAGTGGGAVPDATTTTVPSASTTVPVSAPATVPVTTMSPATEQAIRLVRDALPGDVIARIVAPEIGLDKYVVEGVGVDQLRAGPGRYQGSSVLGARGNASVAGHRSTYGAPFGRLDELLPGDTITVMTPVGDATYQVIDPLEAFASSLDSLHSIDAGHAVVGPDDGFVLGDFGDDRLTLTACHPRYSARERIVVVARLVGLPLALLEPAVTPPDPTSTDPAVTGGGDVTPVTDAMGNTQSTVRPATPNVKEMAVPNLRQGLDGLPEELAPTIVLALLMLVTIAGITVTAASMGSLRAGLFGVLPFCFVLWNLFEHVGRLLPAY
ncbi:unannotated protein [freshwater metagenome]|uniref:Unannotated protein n=1 Tax=freshwater metagenome TaxID=449393 RepID=A0A6J7F8P1_9ZZZZ|nr:sortase [Actinomycetota bacterium]